MPLVGNPEITQLSAPLDHEQLLELSPSSCLSSLYADAMYPVIALPPLSAGAVHETVIFPSNGLATEKVNPVGIPGLVAKVRAAALAVAP